MIDRSRALPLAAHVRELGIGRGAIYDQPASVCEDGLMLVRWLGKLHLDFLFAGSRMLHELLKEGKLRPRSPSYRNADEADGS